MFTRTHHPRPSTIMLTTLLAAAAVAACGSDDSGSASSEPPDDTGTPTETAPPADTTPATPADTAARPQETDSGDTATNSPGAATPWSMDAIGPGTFATTIMEPGFTVTYGEGWVPLMPESKNQINIEIPESEELGCAPCALLNVNSILAESPDDAIDYATSNGVELADPIPTTVGGIAAERYEVTGGAGEVLETEFSQFSVDSAMGPARLTVLSVDEDVVMIVQLAMPAVADAMFALSDDVIESIEWNNS